MNINDFDYDLPEERIASFPLENRDYSKLLIYRNGHIDHSFFYDLPEHLSTDAHLFFNNTKVVYARLKFQKASGGNIELLVMNPTDEVSMEQFYQSKGTVDAKCMVGNKKKWKGEQKIFLSSNPGAATAEWKNRKKDVITIEFPKEMTFADFLEAYGEVPLPPYLNRDAQEADKEHYQSLFAEKKGAVAAPTASLHFTQALIDKLKNRGNSFHPLTLYVGAGTFKPLDKENPLEHEMHSELISIRRKTVESLLNCATSQKPAIAIGTTSLRTLESLYWYGVKRLNSPNEKFIISQEDAYNLPQDISLADALAEVLREKEEHFVGKTALYIHSTYTIRTVNALITNFHLPKSTLLLLVSAVVGDHWRKVYQSALEQDYRFLSYGDGSLLWVNT